MFRRLKFEKPNVYEDVILYFQGGNIMRARYYGIVDHVEKFIDYAHSVVEFPDSTDGVVWVSVKFLDNMVKNNTSNVTFEDKYTRFMNDNSNNGIVKIVKESSGKFNNVTHKYFCYYDNYYKALDFKSKFDNFLWNNIDCKDSIYHDYVVILKSQE